MKFINRLDDHFRYTLARKKFFGLDIFVPDPDEVKTLYEKDLAAGAIRPFPFWTRVWPSAMALSKFIISHPDYIEGKKILELGAGLAIPSLVASRFAGSILTSDYIEEAVMLMRKNIGQLALGNIHAERLDWHDLPAGISADTILLSDVNYSPESGEVLHNVIERFILNGSAIILTTPGRLVAKSFIDFLMPYIVYRELKDIDGTDIFIAVLRKKP